MTRPRILDFRALIGVAAFVFTGCESTPREPCTAVDLSTCRQRCYAKDGESCAIAGAVFVETDGKKATDFFLKGCLHGHAKSCYAAGLSLMLRNPPSTEMAARSFEAGCQLSHPDSCAMRTALIEASHGGPAEGVVAEYDRACSRGSAVGCTLAGTHYLAGQGVPPDAALGAQFLNRACELGEATACKRVETPPAPGTPAIPPAPPAPTSVPPPTTQGL